MLLCADLDGAVVVKDHPEIIEENLRAIQKWRKAGNDFGLMTGRNKSVLEKIFPEWKEKVDFVATDNGGVVFDVDDELHGRRAMPGGLVLVIERLAGVNAQPAYYTAFRYGIEWPQNEAIIKLRLWFHTASEALVVKGKIETRFGDNVQVLPWLRKGYSPLPGVDLSKYVGFLDVISIGSGKSNAISSVARAWKITNDEILTVGNDYNDIAMLRKFRGFAIVGSDPEVVQAAQGRTVASVADVIEKNFVDNLPKRLRRTWYDFQ